MVENALNGEAAAAAGAAKQTFSPMVWALIAHVSMDAAVCFCEGQLIILGREEMTRKCTSSSGSRNG